MSTYKQYTIKNTVYFISIYPNDKYTFIYPEKNDKDTAVVVKPDDEDKPLKGKILFKMNKNAYPEKH